MASMTSEVKVKTELRPCLVQEPDKRMRPALWHRWTHESEVLAPSPLIGGHRGGQLSHTFALVEFEDGTVAKVHPERVQFLGSAGKFEEYDWSI